MTRVLLGGSAIAATATTAAAVNKLRAIKNGNFCQQDGPHLYWFFAFLATSWLGRPPTFCRSKDTILERGQDSSIGLIIPSLPCTPMWHNGWIHWDKKTGFFPLKLFFREKAALTKLIMRLIYRRRHF